MGIKEPSISQSKSETEEVVEDYFERSLRDDEGRYQVSLPWSEVHPELLDNRNTAERRLKSCIRALRKRNCLQETFILTFVTAVLDSSATSNPKVGEYLKLPSSLKNDSSNTFAKDIPEDGDCFEYLYKKFPGPSAGLKLANYNRRCLDGCKWSQSYGINSKQMVLSPGRSAEVATEHQHLLRITTWHYAHNDISGQRLLSLLVTLLLCLEEEFPGKQATVVLQRLFFTPGIQVSASL
ncbi:hypothetical protein TNCV_3171901 [Trichonephila clavipes]|nr:hypothetical protein TNCV_3171901 [Trichonephila clavipes]